MAGACYSVKKNRIQRGYHPGFDMKPDGTLMSCMENGTSHLYLRAIDSAVSDSSWGRLSFSGIFSEGIVCYVYIAALNEDSFYRSGNIVKIEDFLCNPDESDEIKKEFMTRAGGKRFVNQKDILLYQFKGRYLYFMMEIIGEGSCTIKNMKIEARGDNFMQTFPEIYRENDSFFHRYMSVFSSIYNDFDADISKLPELLDLDKCPADILPLYAAWMGIDVGNNFLEERIMRPLVKQAYSLNRIKGTKVVLERISKLVLDEDVLILERNVMQDYIGKEQMSEFERLYGNSIYDVTVLVQNSISEACKSQLLFLLNQFKPIRTRLHIIVLKKEGTLDDYTYLDMNASISAQKDAVLDERLELDGVIRMQ